MNLARLTVLLCAITVAHLPLRMILSAPGREDMISVSPVEIGSLVPNLAVDPIVQGDRADRLLQPGLPCQIIVAIDPSCPHCRKAAVRVGEGKGGTLIPSTWVTPNPGPAVVEFAHLTRSRVRVVTSEEIFEALQVRAVPAAFLISSDARVVQKWPYTGGEDHDALMELCTSSSAEASSLPQISHSVR